MQSVCVCVFFFTSVSYFQVFMEGNNINPEEQSDLDTYCLQYRLPGNISRQEEQITNVVTGGPS